MHQAFALTCLELQHPILSLLTMVIWNGPLHRVAAAVPALEITFLYSLFQHSTKPPGTATDAMAVLGVKS